MGPETGEADLLARAPVCIDAMLAECTAWEVPRDSCLLDWGAAGCKSSCATQQAQWQG